MIYKDIESPPSKFISAMYTKSQVVRGIIEPNINEHLECNPTRNPTRHYMDLILATRTVMYMLVWVHEGNDL